MRYTVMLMPRATRQMAIALVWWWRNRLEAPRLLQEDLEAALDSLELHPERGSHVHGGVNDRRRYILTARLRYAIIYRVRPRARRVEVIAIWDPRRGTWP